MKRVKKRRSPKHRRQPQTTALLDTFAAEDLARWDTRSTELQSYADRVYFDLERQRASRHDDLCAALRSIPAIDIVVDRWVRVTDWQWNLTPLSPAGSLKGIGGRFNIGSDLDRARGQAFPCIYIASDIETAYREYFGGALSTRRGRLTLAEFALRRETSFTTFSLQGHIDQLLDLRSHAGLTAFVRIIATFDVSKDTKALARSLAIAPRTLITTPNELRKRLLMPPHQWRTEPQMFGIPAPNQIFGRLVRDAGFEGILYPSQQGGADCIAVYPENFRGSCSRIEVIGGAPAGATHIKLAKDSL